MTKLQAVALALGFALLMATLALHTWFAMSDFDTMRSMGL